MVIRSIERRQRVLLTGATGVVGQALLPRLTASSVVCLARRPALPGTATAIGDVSAPRLGLSAGEYRRLAGWATTVVHAAAVTDFTSQALERTNIDGTRRVVEFVQDSGAHLVHVSTAYLEAGGGSAAGPARYAASKRAGEQVVRESGVAATIARPSIVIGDSTTGVVARHQGVYKAGGAFLSGRFPIAPLDPDWFIDLIPQDVVAAGLVRLLDGRRAGETVWLTAGPRALRLRQVTDLLTELAWQIGRPIMPPRFVDPGMYRRLIAPVLLEALPAAMRTSLTRTMDELALYMAATEPFPTSVPALLGVPETQLPDTAAAFVRCMTAWAAERGLVDRCAVGEPAELESAS